MTYRTVTVLAAALVVLGALALFAQYRPQPADPGGELLLPGLRENLDPITRMTVLGAGAEPVVTLEREEAGWSVAEKNGYPADLEKIRHTLVSLAEARVVEAKTANPDYYDRLGVEAIENDAAGGVAVTLTGADVNVIVGDTESDSRAYVRKADEAGSYLIDRDPEVGRSATDWLVTGILAIPGSRMARVTVTHADGEVVSVFKDDPAQTNFSVEHIPPDRELQYAGVANVMGTVLSNLNLQDVEPLAAADAPVTVTEFLTFDGLAVTAEALEREDEAWVAFRAEYRAPAEGSEPGESSPEDMSVESAETESGTGESVAGASADAVAEAPESAEASPGDEMDADEEMDVEAEAQELDRRLSGWRYRIANYQFDQMTRRMNDLLQSPPDE